MEKIIVKIFWENNYGAVCEEIHGCVATANTLEAVKKEYASALQSHIQGMIEDGEVLPILQGEYEIEYDVDAMALLHSTEGLISKSALSKASGINQKLLGHYMSGYRTPRREQRNKILNGIHKIGKELMNIK